jgi:hypothetical protein
LRECSTTCWEDRWFFYSPPSLAHSGQWTEPLALIRALPNFWQCYFRLRPSGQCFALLKIVPDDFFFKNKDPIEEKTL